MFFTYSKRAIFCLLTALSINAAAAIPHLTLERAIEGAVTQDIWHRKNQADGDMVLAQAITASALPNPQVGMSINNLASDSFDFNQEAMTQFKLSVSQKLNRGDSADLSAKMQRQRFQMFPLLAQDRRAQLRLAVAKLWLDAYANEQRQLLVSQERQLLEQLISNAQRRYESGDKAVSQSDIVSAQVELAALDDRITQLQINSHLAKLQLREWLPDELVSLPLARDFKAQLLTSDVLPVTSQAWSEHLYQHPKLQSFIKMHQALMTNVDIAKESYKPQWQFNASYGLRGNEPQGVSRADLLSVGVSVDVPLFNEERNDSKVTVAKRKLVSHQTERLLLLKSMIAKAQAQQKKLQLLTQRQEFYQQQLLPQVTNLVSAATTDYYNEQGDFAAILRASLAKLNRQIQAFDIDIERQLTIFQLQYFLNQAAIKESRDE